MPELSGIMARTPEAWRVKHAELGYEAVPRVIFFTYPLNILKPGGILKRE